MDSMILILVAAFIFLPYMMYLHRKKRKSNGHLMQLRQVEAGPTSRFLNHRDMMSMVNVNMGNISIDPELQYFVVRNQCMQVKGISDGDIVGVRMFGNEADKNFPEKEGLMLLIYLNDEHFKGYKIREKGELTADGTAYNTYHYKGGVEHLSSKPHLISSIKGVVVEVHQRQFVSSMD